MNKILCPPFLNKDLKKWRKKDLYSWPECRTKTINTNTGPAKQNNKKKRKTTDKKQLLNQFVLYTLVIVVDFHVLFNIIFGIAWSFQ
jgi:hypothetical protein